jgi:hypothetical protein
VDGEDLRTFITTFFGNIFMAIMGVAAIRFMVKREFVAFSSFTVVAVGVGVFLYRPEVIEAMARAIADTRGG